MLKGVAMKRNDLIRYNEKIYRVLSIEKDELLVIDCSNKAMPYRIPNAEYEVASHEMLTALKSFDELSPEKRAEALKKYSIIAPIVAMIGDDCQRQKMINLAVQNSGKSPQTIRSYLRAFLIHQDIAASLPLAAIFYFFHFKIFENILFPIFNKKLILKKIVFRKTTKNVGTNVGIY